MKTIRLLPIFPLGDVILPVGGILPLNIFEDRYKQMLNHSLGHNRQIIIAQPIQNFINESKIPNDAELYSIAGLGRIVHFEEKPNGNFRITMLGTQRVRLVEEHKGELNFRLFYADLFPYQSDLLHQEYEIPDKKDFLRLYKFYSDYNRLTIDWDGLQMLEDDKLLSVLAMTCPFSPSEKQALLECETNESRYEKITMLMTMAIHHNNQHDTKEYMQ